MSTPNKALTRFVPAVLVAAVLLVFGQTVHFDFVRFDDDQYVTHNRLIREGSAQALGKLFTEPYVHLRIPLTAISYALERRLFGDWAGGYHATQVVLHAINACLVWMIFRRIASGWPAVFAALAFALHPLQAEPVSWISSRKDLLSSFFYLSSIASHLRWWQNGSRAGYALSLLLMGLAVLSKPTAVSLPILLWMTGRVLGASRAGLCSLGPFFLIALMAVAFNLADPAAPRSGWSWGAAAWLHHAAYALLFYPLKWLVPTGLSCVYPRPEWAPGGWDGLHRFAGVFLPAAAWAVWRLSRLSGPAAFGVLFGLIPLLPALPFFRVSSAIVADRYAYLAVAGFSLAAACWSAEGVRRGLIRPRLALGAAGVMIFLWGALCVRQVSVWKDSVSLFESGLRAHPWNAVLHLKMGDESRASGRWAEAVSHYSRAVELRPEVGNAYRGRALALWSWGRYAEALEDMDRAAERDPDGWLGARPLLEWMRQQQKRI